MGGHPWFYFVAYEADVDSALQKLRQREFHAGRYNPVMRHLPFPLGPQSPCPGAQHRSIKEALKAAAESGTRSILDMERVSATPRSRVVAPLADADLRRLFGSERPTHDVVHNCDALFEELERGQGVYIIVYKGDKPHEIFFAGYSFD
jgi:hypothetical protein